MSQTIDLTGLSPDAIRAVEVLVDILRKSVPQAGGTEPPPSGGTPLSVGVGSYPLSGIPIRYDRPFEPVTPDEWDALK